ncbi:MAG: SDR family oxidoreductase [Betaproteobacteria bacterium]|nr:SDR family oxidoreductase [Betaproteobacteria bacterium]
MSRSILITGATGKIGRVLARHFLAAGDHVIAAGRSVDALAELAIDLAGAGGTLHTLCADLMVPDAAVTVVEGLRQIGCMPDGLINNARNVSFLRTGEDGRVARQDFLDEFMLDVVAPYELVMALASAPDSRLRTVVNIGSQYGAVAPNLRLYTDPVQQSPLQYGVAKAALAHLTKELAVRLAGRGIRVNCVAFGGVEGRVDEGFKQRYAALCPMGRMLGEHELAGPVDVLLSNVASAVTGHIMMVDGGWSAW